MVLIGYLLAISCHLLSRQLLVTLDLYGTDFSSSTRYSGSNFIPNVTKCHLNFKVFVTSFNAGLPAVVPEMSLFPFRFIQLV